MTRKKQQNTSRLLVISVIALLSLTANVCFAGGAIIKKGNNQFSNITRRPNVKVYKHVQANGVTAFSDQAPLHQAYQVVNIECYACDVHSTIEWKSTPLYLTQYEQDIAQAAEANDVDPALIRALIHAESAFNPNARSSKGAMGLMQLMPNTAKELGVKNPKLASENIKGGVKYLALLLETFHGNVKLATAAYNAGPSAVAKYKGIPPYAETQAYVERVEILHERYRSQG